MLQILDIYIGLCRTFFEEKLQLNIPKNEVEGFKGCLEFFRKFNRFGTLTRP